MSRIPTDEVSLEILNYLFNEYDIWAKISDGRLISKVVGASPSHTWPNATSLIIKHFLPNGKHIATTHCVKDTNNNVLHWDAKDFRMNDVRLWRI